MEYGLMWVKYKDGVSVEEVEEITTSFYKQNEKKIKGMEADILKGEEAFQLARASYVKVGGFVGEKAL